MVLKLCDHFHATLNFSSVRLVFLDCNLSEGRDQISQFLWVSSKGTQYWAQGSVSAVATSLAMTVNINFNMYYCPSMVQTTTLVLGH